MDKISTANDTERTPVSENLYHVVWTITDYHKDRSGAVQKTNIFGTYTDLHSAKTAAFNALSAEGYEADWFTTFDRHEDHTKQETWKHGDGTMVYAVAPEGEVFTVTLQTTPNTLGVEGDLNKSLDSSVPCCADHCIL
jgi:hypothetical protein